MQNLRYLLATMAALTLIMSIVSSVSPNYFVNMNAYADDDEEEDDDRSNSAKNNRVQEREHAEYSFVQSLGNHSKVVLQIDDDPKLGINIEGGDLQNGTYDVVFACNSPDIDKKFTDALNVQNGEGQFETGLPLPNGRYTGCEVDVGTLSATFPPFGVTAQDDKEDREERKDRFRSKLSTDDDGVEIEVKVEGLNMTDGSYDAVFACDQPAFNMTLDDAFEVEDGKGEFEAEIGLANNTYSGCDITVEGTVIASFDTFTVSEETEEEQERRVEEKRKEKKERIVTTISGREIHEKHRSERAASPGEYEPGWNYMLNATGKAMQRNQTDSANAAIDLNMTVWKSTGAIILLDVVDGTVEIGNQTYTVVLGYALYTIHHDTLRVGALAVGEDGNVYRLILSGSAVDDEVEFPMESGSIELDFEGSRGPPDRFGNWNPTLDGTVAAS